MSQSKFSLGQLVTTPNALHSLTLEEISSSLSRHLSGDWGDLCAEDNEVNEQALQDGLRLISTYQSGNGVKFWVITEHDRSVTTVLLPEDY